MMRGLVVLLLAELVAFSAATDLQRLRKSFIKAERRLQDIEVDEYDCSSDTTHFNSSVLIDFNGDVSKLNKDTIANLEKEFQKSYSEVAFQLCDAPLFRTISHVSMEVLSESRNQEKRIYETGKLETSNYKHYLKVNIQAECRDCTDETVFSGKGVVEDNSENLLHMDDLAVVYKNIDGEEILEAKGGGEEFVLESCVCPAGTEPEERSPTEAEFFEVFNRSITSLENNKFGDDFQLFELEEFDCYKRTSDFQTTVYVRVAGDVRKLEDSEVRAIEEAFMATYNDLNFNFCDFPYFRTIVDVVLDTSSHRQVHEEDEKDEKDEKNKHRKLQGGPPVYLNFNKTVLLVDAAIDVSILKMTVFAECRGYCHNDTALFSYGAEATTEAEFAIADALDGHSNEMQGDAGYCMCPAHPEPLLRSPTNPEFQTALNITMGHLQKGGLLKGFELQDVLEVTEVDCDFDEIEFTSTIYVNLDKPLEMLTEEEALVVEESFRSSYNALTFATCDQFFRDLEEVRLVPTMIRRRLEGPTNGTNEKVAAGSMEALDDIEVVPEDDDEAMESKNGTQNRFPAAFSVRGKCRNCPVSENGNFELFDETFNENVRRTLKQARASSFLAGPAATRKFHNRRLEEKLEVCSCPSDVAPDGTTAPTEDAFLDIFNGDLTILESVGALANFGLVTDLVETSMLCGGESFAPHIDRYELVFVGDTGAVEDTLFSETFRLSYNNQRPGECDPLLAHVFVNQRDLPFGGSLQDVEEFTNIIFGVDSLQTEVGSIFTDEETFVRFAGLFNAVMKGLGYSARVVSAELLERTHPPSNMPSTSPTKEPTKTPSEEPTKSPSREPSKSPSEAPSSRPTISPSKRPSIPPSEGPSAQPTNNVAMCNPEIVTRLTDHVVIDYSISRIADVDIDLPFDLPEIWPLQEPATLIAAEEYIAAYNKLQNKVFCDPFARKMVTVSCASIRNEVLSGRLCCTVNFKCFGNCEEFIFPDRAPIGAFYDESGFGYPTDDSCVCATGGPDRAPSASEHFDKINENVPFDFLSFDFVGFASKACPSS